ncbi:MAG: site-2 protease family protein [Thermomicrobiales bacterium]
MGGFDFAVIISLFYVLIGLRVARDTWRGRATIFDRTFTPHDRFMVSQAAFFLLVPLSVALHEFGHAVAIWSFGGHVDDFGFYFFAGYVGFNDPFTPVQHLVVAAAGVIVNILIAIVVLSFVFFKPKPMRPAVNDLLITFAALQAVNALIFYPLLDFTVDLNGAGDWRQMYSNDAGNWRWVVLAIHVSILGGSFLLSRTAWFNKRLNSLTGMPAGVNRGLMGGGVFGAPRPARGQKTKPTAVPNSTAEAIAQPARRLTLVEERLVEVGKRVASGWNGSVVNQLRSTPSASEMLMVWSDGVTGVVRTAALRALPDGSGELWGLLFTGSIQQPPAVRTRLERWDALPDENALTFSLRIGMEQIARWPVPTDASRRPT